LSNKNIEYTIESAKSIDAARISILLKTVYINTYGENGVSHEFTNFIEKRFSPDYILSQINKRADEIFVAYHKGNIIGVSEVLENRTCPIRKIQLPELSKLYVLQQFIGKGVGSELTKRTENFLRQKGYLELFLEVYLYNPSAIKFYERQGYKIKGEVDFPMEENTYRNYVMGKVIGKE